MDRDQLRPDQFLAGVAETLDLGKPFIVPTSGSTGSPKIVVLPAAAVRASARAVAERLGGHGQWLAALQSSHVGGLAVFVRSVLAGTTPVVLPPGSFTASRFASATSMLRADHPRYVSLVPTQVARLLIEPAGMDALRRFDRVLIGGASLPPTIAAALSAADVAWTHTYGMSETSGGCIYDGTPLSGVTVRQVQVGIDAGADAAEATGGNGRLMIAGPMLAAGYRGRPDLDALAFEQRDGQRWYRTNDLGHWDQASSRWVIVGRVDDVIISGGHKVHPSAVQDALQGLSGIAEAAVVGVPDQQWGQAVVALVVASPSAALRSDLRGWVRSELRERVPDYAIPWRVKTATSLPRLPGGKIDYLGVQAAFLQEDDRI